MDYQVNDIRHFLETNGHLVLKRVDNNYNLRSFTEKEIEHITDGYTTLLGKGAFGEVYKGTLDGQRPVAVKRYINGTQKDAFAKEVIVHTQINHKNVVRILGCCTEDNALMIVMEFICNGNLYNILHYSDADDGRVPFPFDKRLDIAIESAEALSYMHSMYSPVLHGDIKPANILLDEKFEPKISDFGIARLISADEAQHTGSVMGCIGYLDPVFCRSGILTAKSDVYSFGVVLLEIITRKKAVEGSTCLSEIFLDALKKGKKVRHMFDEEIANTKTMPLLEGIAKIAANCLSMDVDMRPKMVEVADNLRMYRKALQRDQGSVIQGFLAKWKKSPLSNNPILGNVADCGDLKAFTHEEVKYMTKDYSIIFRQTAFKRLYYGVLHKDRPVAVRRMHVHAWSKNNFLKTMEVLSRSKHKNICNVVGFYFGEGSLVYCIYELPSEILQDMKDYDSESLFGRHQCFSSRDLYLAISVLKLPLHKRLSIAVQCAESLVHIHSLLRENRSSCSSEVCGNFCSSNIFLDKNLVPKFFNENLSGDYYSVEEYFPTGVYGFNPGYGQDDPAKFSSEKATPENDVYSFGVVLLELITQRRASHYSRARENNLTLADFLKAYQTDPYAIQKFVKDECSEQDSCFLQQASTVVVGCLERHPRNRPVMKDVLAHLLTIAAAQKQEIEVLQQREQ